MAALLSCFADSDEIDNLLSYFVKYLSHMPFDAGAVRVRREQMLLRLLFRATHSMNAEMARRIRAAGHPEFQPTFTSLLAHVDTEGTAISELARRIGTSRQAVSQLAQSVEAAGLVERLPHPEDGRSIIVRHTDAGRQILLDALDVMSGIEDDYAGLIGAADVAELRRLLGRLIDEIDPAGGLRGAGAGPDLVSGA
jgi:DNA-binding MarR family transcriptional regulator